MKGTERKIMAGRANFYSNTKNHWNIFRLQTFLVILSASLMTISTFAQSEQSKIISYTVDLRSVDLKLYWKDDSAHIFKSIQRLKTWLERKNKKLLFAMNGGMYKKDNSPQGLFIEHHVVVTPLDTASGNGNFYLKPNGVFYITTSNKPIICSTANFMNNGDIGYATQSGPMLVIDGNIHPAFKIGSINLNIRNGVGILPDGNVIFAMSKEEINFHDFASYFVGLGCKNALYLDGFVSRIYLPEKSWVQTDGNFGVIIGVTEK